MALSVYRGINFPFTKSATAFPAPVSDADLIRESLIQIIMTQTGERIMRPDFGTKSMSFVFEGNTDILAELISTDIRAAIATFEPRVIVTDLTVTPESDDKGDMNRVIVDIGYVVLATKQEDTLQVTVP